MLDPLSRSFRSALPLKWPIGGSPRAEPRLWASPFAEGCSSQTLPASVGLEIIDKYRRISTNLVLDTEVSLMKVAVAAGAEAGSDSQSARTDWTRAEVEGLYSLPFADLVFQAQSVHRENFDANHVETATAYWASRPAAVRKIAVIARKALITTQVSNRLA